MIFNKLKIFVKILMLKIDSEYFIERKNLNRWSLFQTTGHSHRQNIERSVQFLAILVILAQNPYL